MRHALLIEDSPEYQLIVRGALKEQFQITCAADSIEASKALAHSSFDLILIDVGLPGKDGLSLCEELRRDPRLQSTPILFVTGRKGTADVVSGFAAGADDYIQKPFHPDELRARIEARFSRASANAMAQDSFWRGELRFLVGQQRVLYKGGTVYEQDLELTPNEFKILYHLAKNESRILARTEILNEVWGKNLHVVERTVDKHICSLRKKLGAASPYVASIPGEGYVFRSAYRHESAAKMIGHS